MERGIVDGKVIQVQSERVVGVVVSFPQAETVLSSFPKAEGVVAPSLE